MRLASRFGRYNSIRRERPLTDDELMQFVPSVFSGDKHESRSERYTYIPTINIINKLRDEGFQPFFACQSRVRDLGRREYSKHMLRLRREGHINGQEVPEIILLNSHDGSSSYQMIPGIFRFVCTNGLVCGNNFGEIRVPHKGDIVGQVIEGAYEVLGVFDKVTDNMESMKEIHLNSDEQHLFGRAALMVRYEDENKTPVTPEQIITPRRRENKQNDLWTTWQRVQENMIKGGLSGRSASGKNAGALAEQITWKQMDAQNLEFPDETFDAVVSRNLTWNLEKPEKAYEEWMRVLKPEGKMLNYDANWYHHLFDQEKRRAYEEDRKRVESLQMEDHYTCTDIDSMEEIAREVPLSRIARPQWDIETIKALGYKAPLVEKEVWKEVWSQEERANYHSTPMFLVVGEKQ